MTHEAAGGDEADATRPSRGAIRLRLSPHWLDRLHRRVLELDRHRVDDLGLDVT
jgi:hypothetical protein